MRLIEYWICIDYLIRKHPLFRPLLSIYGHCYNYWFTLYSGIYNTDLLLLYIVLTLVLKLYVLHYLLYNRQNNVRITTRDRDTARSNYIIDFETKGEG